MKLITQIKSMLFGFLFALNLQATVDVQKYNESNPLTPIDDIFPDIRVEFKDKLGEGNFGEVYDATVTNSNGESRKVIAKKAKPGGEEALKIEGKAGEDLRNVRKNMTENTLLSDIQGLEMVSIPVMLDDGTLIQEKINGIDALKAIASTDPSLSPFANGFVDDPQKQIQRIAGLMLGVHALHKAKRVHHDIQLGNIMVGWKKLPDAVIKAIAKSKEIGVEDLDKKDKLEFFFKLIDLGLSIKEGECEIKAFANAAPEHISPLPGEKPNFIATSAYDIWSLATILPSLFFGQTADALVKSFYAIHSPDQVWPSPFVSHFRKKENELLWKNSKRLKDERLRNQVQEYKDGQDKLISQKEQNGAFEKTAWQGYDSRWQYFDQYKHTFSPQNYQLWVDTLNNEHRQIFTQIQKLKEQIQQSEEELNSRKEQIDFQLNFLRESVNKLLHKKIRKDLLNKFQKMNKNMQLATGKIYPDPVLKRIAYMTADCLSFDKKRRPSAEQLLIVLENIGLSDWSAENPTYNIEKEQEFDWMNG